MTRTRSRDRRPDIGLPVGEELAAEQAGLGARRTTSATGNLGVLPIVVGLVFIVVFFSFKATNFFTAENFNNIIIQMAGTTMLAYGVVFVLLLGEIDLSIGYVAGHRRAHRRGAPAPGGETTTLLINAPIRPPRDRPRRRYRRGDRRRAGHDRRECRRAVVRRHPGRLPDLAGRDPARSRSPGSIIIQDRWINYTANYTSRDAAGG